MSLDRKRELRTRFLNWLYETTDGNETAYADPEAFLESVKVDEAELAGVIKYLESEALVMADAYHLGSFLPGIVKIGHLGVVEIEDARSHPAEGTRHLAPIVNITTVHGDMSGQIQQGSPGATQTGTFVYSQDQRAQVVAFTRAVRGAMPGLNLAPAESAQLTGDLDVLEREVELPQPRHGVVREMATSVRSVLEQAAGSAAGTGVVAGILALWPHFIH